ncbi:MAG: acetylxylan esterase [Verrucomicrobia bacterium]|nr:acetylxylan esterase [Verrucomicrobiota bacterium]
MIKTLTLLALAGLSLASSSHAADGPPTPPPLGINASPSLKLAPATAVRPGAAGFLSRWLLLEPIPGDGVVVESAIRAAAKKEYFPNQYSVLPRDGDNVTVDGAAYTWRAVDSSTHNVNLYHFAFFTGKPTSNMVFWGVTIVDCPEEVPNVRLAVGSNAGSVWWVNDQEAVALYGDIQTFIDDTASRKFTLRKGPNVVRFMVVNNRGMVDCCARFLDANDKPLTQFTMHPGAAAISNAP